MATRRKNEKRPRVKKPPPVKTDDVAKEELLLAEEILRTSRKEQAALAADWAKIKKKLGLRAKPVSAQELYEMALREGINPERNEFSRGIIAMREE
jgi:hypothetical protein